MLFGPGDINVDWMLSEAISDTTNAFIIMHGTADNTDVAQVQATAEFIDTSTVRITRSESGTMAVYSVQVVEALPGLSQQAFTVQHGSTNFLTTDSTKNETISSIDASQSIVMVSNTLVTTNADLRTHALLRAELTSNTNVQLSRAVLGSALDVRYQVITFNPLISVQKGDLNMIGVNNINTTISPVDLGRSMVFATWDANNDGLAQTSPRLWLNSTTQINADRTTSNGNTNIRYAVVELPVGTVVQADNNTGSPSFNSTTTTDVTLSAVSVSHSFNTHTNKTTGTGTAFPRPYVNSYLTSSTNLNLRADYTGQTNTVSYYVADTSGWFDNLVTGTIMSPEIDFVDGNRDVNSAVWKDISFTTDETNGDIKVQVYHSDITTCDTIIPDIDLPGNSTGFDSTIDISGLDTAIYSHLCLQAQFDDIGGGPELLDWSVSWGPEIVETDANFIFTSDLEGWNFVTDNASCTGVHTAATGNPAGSLQINGSKSGGGQTCNTYWEWTGTWEDLGVPVGYVVSGISGDYEYAVSNDSSNGTYTTGAFELLDNAAVLRETLVTSLAGQSGVIGFTQRTGASATFTQEASNTQLRLRLHTNVSFGGGNRTWTGQNDNINLIITSQPDPGIINQTISFNLSANTLGFGNLSTGQTRYATNNGLGSDTPSIGHTLSVTTNATNGYSVQVSGDTLSCDICGSGITIDAIGATASPATPGTEQFGLRTNLISGNGIISSPYNTVNYAYDGISSPDELVTGPGDDVLDEYSIEYMANIGVLTDGGDYATDITYTITASF